MRFVTYLDADDVEGLGYVSGEFVYPVSGCGLPYRTMEELIEHLSPADRILLDKAPGTCAGTLLDEVRLLAPIPRPRHDLICVGQNYTAHGMEVAAFKGIAYEAPEYPCYFSKRTHRAVAHGETINPHFDINDSLDYETELTVVIGKICDHVKPEDVWEYIFGYTIANDVSARTIQKRQGGQYYLGKSLEGFSPVGPWIVTADEFSPTPIFRLRTRVNGEIRQNSTTSDFIFDIPRLVSELSAGFVLYPGDLILTGTPSGVGVGHHPPKFLKTGDVVECEIEGIGVLRNTVGE